MRIFSIDPGLSGAWALVVDGRAEACGDMPTTGEKPHKHVGVVVLGNHMKSFAPDLCVIEQAWSRPTDGGVQAFKFGTTYGQVLAIPRLLGFEVETVSPQAWKRRFKLLKQPKSKSRAKALELCPWLDRMLYRERDEGRAEAVLIGLYAAALWDQAVAA